MRLKERTGLLDRNYWTKIISREDREITSAMNKLNDLEGRLRFANLKGTINVFLESWMEKH